jgi:hypothetical protein
MRRPLTPPPGCRSFLELHNLDCSDVSEAEIDYFLACQAAMQLGMEDESDSSDY